MEDLETHADEVPTTTTTTPSSLHQDDLALVASALLGVLLANLVIYAEYGSIGAWVQAIDYHEGLFTDFFYHYLPQFRRVGTGRGVVHGFYYPPLFAVLGWPIGQLSDQGAQRVWWVFLCACSLLWAWLPARWLRRDGVPMRYCLALGPLTALSMAVWHNLVWGQISLTAWLLAVTALRLADTDRPRTAALTWALASGIKPFAALLLPLMLLRAKRPQRLVRALAIATPLLCVVVPFLAMGVSTTIDFYRDAADAILSTRAPAFNPNSQHVGHVLRRLLERGTIAIDLSRQIGWACSAALLGGSLWLARRDDPIDRWLAVILSLALSATAFKTGWLHYLVWLPLAATITLWAIFARTSKPVAAALTAFVWLPSVALCLGPTLPLWPSWREYTEIGMPAASVTGLVLLSCGLARWRRPTLPVESLAT